MHTSPRQQQQPPVLCLGVVEQKADSQGWTRSFLLVTISPAPGSAEDGGARARSGDYWLELETKVREGFKITEKT